MVKYLKNDLVLARNPLPEGTINLTIGEPDIIKRALEKTLTTFGETLNYRFDPRNSKYPPAAGTDELKQFLSFKYQKPVVITNGAKQGLSAAIYALRDDKKANIYVPKPYWLSFPVLINKEGCKMVHKEATADFSLITAPNNPDSNIDYISYTSDKPIIFDGAYYCQQYLPNHKLEVKGNIHLVSCSKKFGLSGLRIGYAICESEELATKMSEYLEITTMGTSDFSQKILYDIEVFFYNNPNAETYFHNQCKNKLGVNINKLKQIDKSILDPNDIKPNGMFAFLKKGKNFIKATEKAKVNIIDGVYFGDKTRARISLGLDTEIFAEAIDKLNKSIV